MGNTREKFIAIEKELNGLYFERADVIRGLVVGLLAKRHVIVIGPPGTAKTETANDLCNRIEGSEFFRWLLNRTSVPEEPFGPVSLQALKQDSYRRVTKGKLPEADIAFLDEIFKCNSAVLNLLLPILNEGEFFNDGQPIQVPLQMLVGASNELPEDREELGALWDRFLLRFKVGYIKDPRNFDALLTRGNGAATTTITRHELAQAQAEAAAVKIDKLVPRIAELRGLIAQKEINVSDRRWRQSLDIIRAHAWLEGRAEAEDEDLAILGDSLWDDPSQILAVKQTILNLVNPADMEAQTKHDEALEVYLAAINAPEEKKSQAGHEANKKLKNITNRLKELRDEAGKLGKNPERINNALKDIVAWNRDIARVCLGLEI